MIKSNKPELLKILAKMADNDQLLVKEFKKLEEKLNNKIQDLKWQTEDLLKMIDKLSDRVEYLERELKGGNK